MRSTALAVAFAALFSLTSVALAHRRPIDGGIAQRGCPALFNQDVFVGATRVDCATARNVVKTVKRHPRRRLRGWRCIVGRRAARGHCHRRGHPRRIVHWTPGDKPTSLAWQSGDFDNNTELFIGNPCCADAYPFDRDLREAVRAGKWSVQLSISRPTPAGCSPGSSLYINSKERFFYILDRKHYSFRLLLPMDAARDGIGGTFEIAARQDGLGRFVGSFRVRGRPFDCSGIFDTGTVPFVATRPTFWAD